MQTKRVVLAVAVTANVSVTSCADTVDWNRPCNLTCSAFDGNPPDYTLQWQFKSKFSETFQVLTSEIAGNSTDLSLSIVTMGDAGTYRCNARNFAGAAWADLQLEVNCKQQNLKIESKLKMQVKMLVSEHRV